MNGTADHIPHLSHRKIMGYFHTFSSGKCYAMEVSNVIFRVVRLPGGVKKALIPKIRLERFNENLILLIVAGSSA